jgi:hypothetical protein
VRLVCGYLPLKLCLENRPKWRMASNLTIRIQISNPQELATLEVETIQLREGRWVLADLEGKGRDNASYGRDPGLDQAGNQCLNDRCRHRGGPTAEIDLQRWESWRESARLGGLVHGRAIGKGDWDRAIRSPRPARDLSEALPEDRWRPGTSFCWALFHPDNRALSGVRAGDRHRGKRLFGALSGTLPVSESLTGKIRHGKA